MLLHAGNKYKIAGEKKMKFYFNRKLNIPMQRSRLSSVA